jgi:uncharacterized protein
MSRLIAVFALILAWAGPLAAAEPHRLALQISDNDPEKMTAVLNVAANVSKHYSDKGEEVEIQIIAFNDASSARRHVPREAAPRILREGHAQCQLQGLPEHARRHGAPRGQDPTAGRECRPGAAGVVTLMELARQGWTIVRP